MTIAIRPSRWIPAPFLQASVALHAGAALLTTAEPGIWPWTVSMLAGDHALLTAATLWPRSSLLGPNLTRLPPVAAARSEIALTIDDGPDPDVTPKVLELLGAYGAVANFFCIGDQVVMQPDLCRVIVDSGHHIENHSQRHRYSFSLLGPDGISREVEAAQESIYAMTGRFPRFFRAPAGLRNLFLDPVLHRLDLTQTSWTRRGYDTRERDVQKVYRRLTSKLAAGDILLLHDGHAARTIAGVPVILEVLPRLLDTLAERGLHTTLLETAVNAPPYS